MFPSCRCLVTWSLVLIVQQWCNACLTEDSPESTEQLLHFAKACQKLWGLDNVVVLSSLQSTSELHPQLSPMVTSGTLGQFQLVFQAKDVGDVLDGALDQDSATGSDSVSGSAMVLSLGGVDLTSVPKQLLQDVHWFLPANTTNFDGVHLRLDSRIFLYEHDLCSESIKLSEVYAIKSGPRRNRHVGTWNKSVGLAVSQPQMFERRKDLSGVTIINTLLPWNPICIMHEWENGTLYDASGLFLGIYKLLAETLNFDTYYTKPADGSWGSLKDNGSWTGLVGQLQRGDADICTAGLSVVLERTFYIDYTVSVRKNDIGITVLASNAVTLNIWVFVDVFLGTLWFGILGAAVTLMIMFVLVRVIIAKRFHTDDDPENFDIWNAFALVTMVFMQRDYFFQKLSLTSKILYFTTCITAFTLFAFYTAVLTAEMTAIEPPVPIRSFEDVIKNEYKLHFWKETSQEAYLSDHMSAGSAGHILYQEAKANDHGVMTMNDVVKLFKNEKDIAYFDFFLTTFGMDDNYGTSTKSVKIQEGYETDTSFGLQFDSEFKGMFDFHIDKMRSTGLMAEKELLWLSPDRPTAPTDPNDSVAALGYNNLLFPMAILVIGVGVGLALVLLEQISWLSYPCGMVAGGHRKTDGAMSPAPSLPMY